MKKVARRGISPFTKNAVDRSKLRIKKQETLNTSNITDGSGGATKTPVESGQVQEDTMVDDVQKL